MSPDPVAFAVVIVVSAAVAAVAAAGVMRDCRRGGPQGEPPDPVREGFRPGPGGLEREAPLLVASVTAVTVAAGISVALAVAGQSRAGAWTVTAAAAAVTALLASYRAGRRAGRAVPEGCRCACCPPARGGVPGRAAGAPVPGWADDFDRLIADLLGGGPDAGPPGDWPRPPRGHPFFRRPGDDGPEVPGGPGD